MPTPIGPSAPRGDVTAAHPRIAVLDAPAAGRWPGLDALAADAEIVHASSADELARALEGAEILVVTDIRTGAVEPAWPSASALRWIHATSAGVDAIVFPELAHSSVALTNARGVFDRAIAETVVGHALAFAKDMRRTFELQSTRTWRHRETEAIGGSRLLVVGAGSIGREIARTARGVGMQPAGVASRAREDDPDFGRIHAADELWALLPDADWVVIAAPLTRATRGLFGARAFRLMKRRARLINVGRGAIVDTTELVKALEEGAIAGAALDVFEEEPLPPDHPLWAFPQAILTSHMAGDFVGWREALSRQFIELFRAYRAGAPLWNAIDKRSLLP